MSDRKPAGFALGAARGIVTRTRPSGSTRSRYRRARRWRT
jgi:hypothetical protein